MRLPETWKFARLSEVCQINPIFESQERPDKDQSVTFLPMSAVDEVFGEISSPDVKKYKEVAKGFTPFREGDVLFAKITPSMENGKAAIAKNLINGIGFGSTEFHVLRPIEYVLAEYLFYFIRQTSFRKWAQSSFIGSAGQQRVPADFLQRVLLPLPTVSEQQRIVAILRQADELHRLRQESVEQANRISAALFLEMFGNPVININSKRWKVNPFGTFITYSKYGPRFPGREYSVKGARVLRTTDMTNDGSIRWWESPIIELTDDELMQHALKPRTLLVSRSGTIGPIAVFEGSEEPCVAGAYLLEFGLSEKINTEYIRAFFLSEYGQSKLKAGSRSATQSNLNAPAIKNIQIPIPPKKLQDEFAQKVNELEKLKQKQIYSSDKLDILQHVIISEAFSGLLTEEWRKSYLSELESAARKRDEAFGKFRVNKVTFKEYAPPQRPWQYQHERGWLKNQMSELQGYVWTAMDEWQKTFIPSEHMEGFLEQFPVEHLENPEDQVLRVLNQLAGLGLIAQITLQNSNGEYVTAFRGFREEEFSKARDIKTLKSAEK